MICLWLTLADPDPPSNGQFIYSGGMIRAITQAGAALEVVGLELSGGRHRNGDSATGIRWWLGGDRPRSQWRCLASPLPHICARTKTRSLRRLLDILLAQDRYDAVVFDSITLGWALRAVLRQCAHGAFRPRLIYLAHNHETSVARKIACDERRPLVRWIKRLDAFRVRRLEQALARSVDLITANSPDDCAKFLRDCPGNPVAFLPPGYDGPCLAHRTICTDRPRRAIIVGSFDWAAKRADLEDFLRVADPLFGSAGIELHVVGNAETSYLARLRKSFATARFTGHVDDLVPHMREARLALVIERFGGFKLKTLDYVFNRLPILAIAGSAPGLPLRDGHSILSFSDHDALARGVLGMIDDFDRLNRLQNRAYDACEDQFDWEKLGRRLFLAMSRAETQDVDAGVLPLRPYAFPDVAHPVSDASLAPPMEERRRESA